MKYRGYTIWALLLAAGCTPLDNSQSGAKNNGGQTGSGSTTRGPAFGHPHGIAHHSQAFYITDSKLHAVIKVDQDGNRSIFSGTSGSTAKGTGPAFFFLRGIVSHHNALYVVNSFRDKVIIKVDQDGNRSVFSGTSGSTAKGTGPALSHPSEIAYHNGAFYVSDLKLKAIIKVEMNGNRSIFSKKDGRGTGPAFSDPRAIAYYKGAFYVSDLPKHPPSSAIIKVEMNGDRSVFSKKDGRGTGPHFSAPFGIIQHNGAFYVTDFNRDTILQVDMAGNRSIFSKAKDRWNPEEKGTGPNFDRPAGIIWHQDAFYVVTSKALLKIDINGNRKIWSKK